MGKKIVVILLVNFFLFWHWFDPSSKKNQRGIQAFHEQKYEEALNEFLSAKGIKPDLEALKNNTAATLYQLKKYKEALEEFSKIDPEKTQLSRSNFFYNIGNSFFRLNQFDKALESYKKSLISNPDDIAAKKNFEITLKKIEEQKKQKKDQQDQQDKQQQENKKEDPKDQEKDNQPQQNQQKPEPKNEEKYKNLMQYLNQNEKKQQKKKKRTIGIAKKEKDW